MKNLMKKMRIVLSRIKHRKRIHKEIDGYIKTYHSIPEEQAQKYRRWFYRDTLRAKLKYGVIEKEYFQGEFFRKSRLAREESMFTGYRFSFRRSIQSAEGLKRFGDKHSMYKAYERFLGRRFLLVDANTTPLDIKNFLNGKNCFFAKTLNGMGGKGVRKIKVSGEQDIQDFLKECPKPILIEEELKQTDAIAAFNSSSVNTMRIVTVITDKGDVVIPTAFLRIGKDGSCLDNFSSGGIGCKINIEHGILTTAVDATGRRYVFHPNSGLQLIGYHIPEWDKYKEFAIELAKVDPTMRYVGWDIIMDRDGCCCVIEGNEGAGFGMQEMAGGNAGLKFYYHALLHDNLSFDCNRFM